MNEVRTPAQEAAEDLFFGQSVIIWARWFVILAGALLALWSASSIAELTIAILLLVLLMAINFFVHGRYLMEKPINRAMLYIISLMDLIIITMIVLLWKDKTGMDSPFFIFYYPVLLAFSFVFPPGYSAFYSLQSLAVYLGACILADASFLGSSVALEDMATRLITLAAMTGLSTYYWRIQRKRRRAAVVRAPHGQASAVR